MREINIIIPTFNEKKNIQRLIENLKKEIPRARITIVDDTLDDDIGKIIIKNKYSRVFYHHRKNSRGRGSQCIVLLEKHAFRTVDTSATFESFGMQLLG